jgi:lipopolysaccharide transport system ATP-binding protein
VVNRYIGLVHEYQTGTVNLAAAPGQSTRHGDGAARIVSVSLLDELGRSVSHVESGAMVSVRMRAEFATGVSDPMAGIVIRNRLGVDVFGTNTQVERIPLGDFIAGDSVDIEFHLECLLTRQEYTLTVAVQHSHGASMDWHDDVLSFVVTGDKDLAGLAALPTRVRCVRDVSRNVAPA